MAACFDNIRIASKSMDISGGGNTSASEQVILVG
jgi:hypothetical protein